MSSSGGGGGGGGGLSLWSMKPKKRPAPGAAESSSSSSATKRIKREGEDEDDVLSVAGGGRSRGSKGPAFDPSTTVVSQIDISGGYATRKLTRTDLANLTGCRELLERTLDLFRHSANRGFRIPVPADDIARFRVRLHKLPFWAVNRDWLRMSGILRTLDEISDGERIGVPEDCRLDATSLLLRWRRDDFEPALMRGVQSIKRKNLVAAAAKSGKGKGKEKAAEGSSSGTVAKGKKPTQNTSHSFIPNYPFKKDAGVFGPNGLVIGDWWPLQICALRDGAHGEMEAGIYGIRGQGAISVILSAGGYQDSDNLSVIFYCGTKGYPARTSPTPTSPNIKSEPSPSSATDPIQPKQGIPSANTKLLLDSEQTRNPVRVLRSYKAGIASGSGHKSMYAPSVGIRYDGLYIVTGHTVLDVETAMFRFVLERVGDQPDVRWMGEGTKPNPEEIRQTQAIKYLLKGSG